MSHPIAPSPFVVDSLRPQGSDGRGRSYQLDANSVSPTIVVGYDELGMPIEETIPHTHYRKIVTPMGYVNNVPLRTCVPATMEPEGVQYENMVMTDLIRNGWLPLSECPYTFAYSHIKAGSLIPVPDGAKDCGGAPDGCKHLRDVMVKRREISQARHDKVQATAKTMKVEEVERMIGMMSKGVGEAIAETAKPARSRMVKGETDAG